jgi:hypothetical protein
LLSVKVLLGNRLQIKVKIKKKIGFAIYFVDDIIFETGKVESSRVVVVVVVVVVGVQALNASHLDLNHYASNNVNSHLTSTHSETRSTYAIRL